MDAPELKISLFCSGCGGGISSVLHEKPDNEHDVFFAIDPCLICGGFNQADLQELYQATLRMKRRIGSTPSAGGNTSPAITNARLDINLVQKFIRSLMRKS